jgi:predicted nucleotide-binding protein
MARGREPGKKNRTTPPLPLGRALEVSTGIADKASGMKVSRLTLAEILETTPTSSTFRDLVASSRLYGLTNGGINAQEFDLTEAGEAATSADEAIRVAALKAAVMSIPAYRKFFESFASKKVPATTPFKEFLSRDAQVPDAYLNECMTNIAEDAQTAGLFRKVGGAYWVDLDGLPAPAAEQDGLVSGDEYPADMAKPPADPPVTPSQEQAPAESARKKRPSRLFIGHGGSKAPLDQLTKMLRDLGIPHLVAEDEPNSGRPVSKKVRDTMEQCGAAILIFSADIEYFDKDQEPIWRPSENVSHELGAAAVMYDDRIIIFKEEAVTLASNFSGIVYITFEKDKLDAKMNELLRELVALKILRLSVDDD